MKSGAQYREKYIKIFPGHWLYPKEVNAKNETVGCPMASHNLFVHEACRNAGFFIYDEKRRKRHEDCI